MSRPSDEFLEPFMRAARDELLRTDWDDVEVSVNGSKTSVEKVVFALVDAFDAVASEYLDSQGSRSVEEDKIAELEDELACAQADVRRFRKEISRIRGKAGLDV